MSDSRQSLCLRLYAMISAFVLCHAHVGYAETISEYFNNYGSSVVPVAGLGTASDGWAGAWSGQFPSGSANASYSPGEQLTYIGPGYSNLGNETGPEDGSGRHGAIQNFGNATDRMLANGGFTGTTWISALVRLSDRGSFIFSIDHTRVVGPIEARLAGVGDGLLRASVLYDDLAIFDNSSTVRFSADETHLMLLRIAIGTATTDFTFWMDPDLSGGENGLPSPIYDVAAASNSMIGPTLQEVGFSFIGNGSPIYVDGRVDAIRISNGPNGLHAVSVPEVGVLPLTLLGIGIAACLKGIAKTRSSRSS